MFSKTLPEYTNVVPEAVSSQSRLPHLINVAPPRTKAKVILIIKTVWLILIKIRVLTNFVNPKNAFTNTIFFQVFQILSLNFLIKIMSFVDKVFTILHITLQNESQKKDKMRAKYFKKIICYIEKKTKKSLSQIYPK